MTTSAASAHHDWSGLTPPSSFDYKPLAVIVRGDTACFTRPEFPSERVSYEVPTPSALIGVLSSVFWKPQFRWIVESFDVLKPIRSVTQQRNEVRVAPAMASALKGATVDVNDYRVQRQTLLLRDVAYRVRAQVWVHPDAEGTAAKWREQFSRRVERGQCFRSPYLGMRENVADVLPDEPELTPIETDEDFGLMLHTIAYDENTGRESYSWFRAQMRCGRVDVPTAGSNLTAVLSR